MMWISSLTTAVVLLTPCALAGVNLPNFRPTTTTQVPVATQKPWVPGTPQRICKFPAKGEYFEIASGAEVAMNQSRLDAALVIAGQNATTSIKVFRNNCLVSRSPDDAELEKSFANIFSATKSIIGMLTGIAYTQGKLKVDDPIGKYLPTGPGWGDAAHRAFTIRQLLTESSGINQAIFSEAVTGSLLPLDQSLPQQALAVQIVNPPGTKYGYSQRTPDLMAYVVSQAVGMELQAYAQKYLFGPIGITTDDYVWFKDRAGNSYGYAGFYVNAITLARLGLLMTNNMVWDGKPIMAADFARDLRRPSPTNPCYGWFFWTNDGGNNCTSPTGYTFKRNWEPPAPVDLYGMAGSPQQANFAIPSLNITIAWQGVKGGVPPKDTYYKFVTELMNSTLDIEHFLAPPYELEPLNPSGILNIFDPTVLFANVFSSVYCNILFCNSRLQLGGLFSGFQDYFRLNDISFRLFLGSIGG